MIKPVIKSFAIEFLLAVLTMMAASPAFSQSDLTPAGLCCEGLKDPRGIDFAQPQISWILRSPKRGQRQTAYEVLAASTDKKLKAGLGNLWDSGKVAGHQTVNIAYEGKPLVSCQQCFWKVRVWDQDGNESDWSKPAMWTMGVLSLKDWRAKWIGLDVGEATNGSRRLPARWLRKEFAVGKTIKRATVYFSGLGWSELYLNGHKVGNAVLSPPLSEYPKRVYYVTYDVTQRLRRGDNAMGVVLGNGRFFAPRPKEPLLTLSFGYPKLLLRLRLEFNDGSVSNIVSDDSWKLTANGPIVANNEYDGEEYDARKEFPGWSRPGFDDSGWQTAQIVSAPGGVLSAIRQAPIRVTRELKPVSMKELKPGVFIFDIGQNMVGWCRLKVRGPAGTQVKLQYAETLKPDGALNTANLRSAKATDSYTLKGHGMEIWQPRFTSHGFRFVEVTGFPGQPTLDSLTGCVVNDDLPVAGKFECSNPLLNQIYHNIVWGVRGNYHSIPTDCPQRDERQGWLGDRSEESRGETYLFDNETLYAKWLQDMADSQKDNGSIPDVCPAYWPLYNDDVTWPSTSIIIPNMLYRQFDDMEAVARHYDSAKKWIEHMNGFVTNGIISKDNYGDWCAPPQSPTQIPTPDTVHITSGILIATAYFYHDLCLMERYAVSLGKTADAQQFHDQAAKMKAAFNERFLNRQLGQYGKGTQTSCVLPLAFGLVPDDLRGRIFEHLMDRIVHISHNHIDTGLIGGQYLMRVLTDNGRADLAYAIATQKTYPSWGYMVEHGATTIWELWNGNAANPAMNSRNHVMLVGDLVTWLYEDLAGIKADPALPGFKHIIMEPHPVGDLKFVKATHRSPHGWISSAWKRNGGAFDWRIKIPANTTATVYVPAKDAVDVTESGQPLARTKGVNFLRMEGDRVVLSVESGSYHFDCRDTQ